jgi:hypothetical protein
MNEVIQLADDLNILILYQDTDSMHLDGNKVEQLSNAFYLKYGRNLIGNYLGQFHCDFDKPPGTNINQPFSNNCYFLAKKIYCEDVTYTTDNQKYTHIRMKGVSKGSIEYKANELKISVPKLYEKLYNHEQIDFDLCSGGVKFDRRSDLTIGTKKSFIRSIKL